MPLPPFWRLGLKQCMGVRSAQQRGTQPMASAATIRFIAALAVLWQLIGVVSYLSYVGLIAAGPAEGELDMPALIHTCYAIGVFAGLLGSAALAFLRWWARPLLWLSLIALLVDWGWVLTSTDDGTFAVGLTVLVVAIGLVVLAEKARRRRRLV